MAYSTIANSEIAVGAPITNSLMTKLRDNPEAIATAASGATKIVYSALNLSNDIVAGDIAAGAIGESELSSAIGSWIYIGSASASGAWASTTSLSGYRMYRIIYHDFFQNSGTNTFNIQLYMGGAWRTSGYTYAISGTTGSDTGATGASTIVANAIANSGGTLTSRSGYIDIVTVGESTMVKWADTTNIAGAIYAVEGVGSCGTRSTTTGVRIGTNGSTDLNGTMYIYGMHI